MPLSKPSKGPSYCTFALSLFEAFFFFLYLRLSVKETRGEVIGTSSQWLALTCPSPCLCQCLQISEPNFFQRLIDPRIFEDDQELKGLIYLLIVHFPEVFFLTKGRSLLNQKDACPYQVCLYLNTDSNVLFSFYPVYFLFQVLDRQGQCPKITVFLAILYQTNIKSSRT